MASAGCSPTTSVDQCPLDPTTPLPLPCPRPTIPRRPLCCSVPALLVACTLHAAAATLVWNTGPGNWSNAANWTPNQIPRSRRHRHHPVRRRGHPGRRRLGGDAEPSGGGGDRGGGVPGRPELVGRPGTFNSVKLTIAHGSELNLVGDADKLLVVGVITNHGVVNWTGGGSFKFGFDQAYLRNEADGEFQIRSIGFLGGNPVSDNDGAYILNSGLVTCDVGPGTTTVAVGRGTFANQGRLRVLSGTLSFTDGLVSQGPGNELFVADGATPACRATGPALRTRPSAGRAPPPDRRNHDHDRRDSGDQCRSERRPRGGQSGVQTLLGGRLEWQSGELTDPR